MSHDTVTFDILNAPCRSSFQNTPCQSSVRNAVAWALSSVKFSTVVIISAKLRSGITLLLALILIHSSLATSPRVL